MPVRASAANRIRTKIDALFAEGRELPEILEEVARLGAQLLMQAALEAEVTEFLGRDRYQRAADCPDANAGSRNGYRPVTVKTTTGPVTLERPKLRGTTEAFASRLFGKHVTKTNALETLVIASFVRGLSVRDVEATLAEALGDQAAISKSTVSEVCKAIRAEYQGWACRRLDEITLDYLFLDASFFRMHPGSPAEPVLAAWGISTEGKPVFVGLAPGTGESTDASVDFLADLRDRGLACPLLIVSDGAKGLIAAIERIYPNALRQRCLIHRLRNVFAKIPTGMQAEVRDGYWSIFDTTDLTVEPGPQLGRDHRQADRSVRRQVRRPLPGGHAGLAHRQSRVNRVSAVPGRTSWARSTFELYRALFRGNEETDEGHRPIPRRDQCGQPGVGGARPRLGWLARSHHDTGRHPTAARPTPIAPRPTPQTATALQHERRHRPGRPHLRHRVQTSRRESIRLGSGSGNRKPGHLARLSADVVATSAPTTRPWTPDAHAPFRGSVPAARRRGSCVGAIRLCRSDRTSLPARRARDRLADCSRVYSLAIARS